MDSVGQIAKQNVKVARQNLHSRVPDRGAATTPASTLPHQRAGPQRRSAACRTRVHRVCQRADGRVGRRQGRLRASVITRAGWVDRSDEAVDLPTRAEPMKDDVLPPWIVHRMEIALLRACVSRP